MKFLLIEDDEEKRQEISSFLNEQFNFPQIDIAHSVNAGIRSVARATSETFLLLDMSMPNLNANSDDPGGGTPEHFAGRDILAQMKLRGIFIPTVVITMFDSFGDDPEKISFSQLQEQLTDLYGPFFKGMVYYSASQESWKSLLGSIIRGVQE